GNDYLSVSVATGAGSARNTMIANSVQGAIAIDGSYGTLSEIGHTLRMGKPVVGLDTWDIEGVVAVESPEEAVIKIMELI
ncbi:MAG: TIGR00725 family protein, partial [Fidelibacterota bacterium]